MAEATKSAEAAEQLRGEIAALKAQGESDRIDFKLQFAGAHNVKAPRALLSGHNNMELCQCRDAAIAVNQTLGRKLLTCHDSLNHT